MPARGKRSRRRTRTVAHAEPGKVTETVTGQRAPPRAPRTPVREAIRLVDEEIALLCIAAICSIRTVERWAAGFPVHRTTKIRLERAMAKEGIEKRARTPGRRRVARGTPPAPAPAAESAA